MENEFGERKPHPSRRRAGDGGGYFPRGEGECGTRGSAEKKSRGPERLNSEEGPLGRRASLQKPKSSESV